ncbi:glycosyltransferase, partial [Aquabacterium sp.]|uniref:glycosyltransferase n=1 Tax=Aquabacterium sp. TaxID=1872578 RepID=UPI002E2FA10A
VGACNFGMGLHRDRDVLLLNSDTEVYSDWLDRIRRAAYRNGRTGTVTPFSNNATICSYPKFCEDNWGQLEIDDQTLDALFARLNEGEEVEIPTGVGFCMYLRRDCLDAIGFFDFESFGKGYGEENDLSRRAIAAGWRNILTPDVFVRHYGGASFGESKAQRIAVALQVLNRLHPDYESAVHEFVQRDPVRPYREAIDLARLSMKSEKGSMLFVTHSWGGGTEVHVQEMKALVEAQGFQVLIGRPGGDRGELITFLNESDRVDFPNLTAISIEHGLDRFVSVIRALNVKHVHVHHTAGFVSDVSDFLRLACADAGVKYDVTLHDYMSVCPRITLIDRTGVYCGEPALADCETCIKRDGSKFGNPSVWSWRDRFGRLLSAARHIYVPDEDVSQRMSRYFPQLNFQVKPHPQVDVQRERPAKFGLRVVNQAKRRVAVLGAIGPHKGSELLELLAEHVRANSLPLEFVVVGYTDRDERLKHLGVEITGAYPNEEAVKNLIASNADFVWFSSVWPETFSYTLSAAFRANLYPVGFDFGAVATRIRAANWGQLLPIELMLDIEALALALLNISVSSQASHGGDKQAEMDWSHPVGDNFVEGYYGLELC